MMRSKFTNGEALQNLLFSETYIPENFLLIVNLSQLLSKITAIRQEILTISDAPAGSQEENNTLVDRINGC